MATTSMPAPDASAPISPVGRIIGVFTSPKQTFTSIAEKPSWVAPMLLMMILAVVVGGLLNSKMNWAQYIRHKAEENPRFEQLSDDKKDEAISGQVKFWSSSSYVIGAVFTPVTILIFALIYMASFNLMSGAGVRYGQAFAITTHAFLPNVVVSILAMIILPLKAYGDVDPESIVATSLKAYLPETAPKPLLALGGSLELFWIWCLVLVAIGFAAANPRKVKTGTALGIVFGLWAIWVLGKIAWAAI